MHPIKVMLDVAMKLQSAAVLLTICFCQAALAEEPWTLAKNAEGIKVYTRNVPNSHLREFKAEIDLATNTEQLMKVLKDANSFRQWMPDVVRSELLYSSEKEQYHYVENAAPWPVSNRDGVYHYTFSRTEDADTVVTIVHVEAAPDYSPRRQGKVRISKCDGYWRIMPKGDGVEISYQIHADPGGSIPSWLANATVVDTPFETLKNLRSYIQSFNRTTAVPWPPSHVVAHR